MDTHAYLILFFIIWGLFSFGVFVIRFLYHILTAGKRRAQNEQEEKRRRDAAWDEMQIREDNKKKEAYINELKTEIWNLKNEIERLHAASAPLPDHYFGGELAYDYRDVNIYVPDENFGKMILGNPLFVSRSVHNRYDKDAVSLNYGGEELALLCRGKIQEMALDYIQRGDAGYAIISYIDKETKTVKVHLGFYKGCDLISGDE